MRWVLDEVAWAAGRFKETVFATQFRRLAGHRGNKRAIIVVAHSRLVVLEPAVGEQDRADKKIAGTRHEKRELAFQTVSRQSYRFQAQTACKTALDHNLRALPENNFAPEFFREYRIYLIFFSV